MSVISNTFLFIISILYILNNSNNYNNIVNCELLPELDFISLPIQDPKVVSLTFDDGPDIYGYTQQVLDALNNANVPGCFFINSNNRVNILTHAPSQAIIRNIINSGQCLGSHTAKHLNLSTLTPVEIEKEITDVQNAINTIIPSGYPIRLGRAPYGEPFLWTATEAGQAKVKPVFGKYHIHIGWGIDGLDFNCASVQCVVNNVMAEINKGFYGIIYLHSTNQYTPQALPQIISQIKAKGLRFVRVEDIIASLYGGLNSTQLYQKYIVEDVSVPLQYQPIPTNLAYNFDGKNGQYPSASTGGNQNPNNNNDPSTAANNPPNNLITSQAMPINYNNLYLLVLTGLLSIIAVLAL